MKVLILGADGFIGSRTTRFLLQNTNHEVIAVDRKISTWNIDLNIIQSDVDIGRMSSILNKCMPDVVINYIAEKSLIACEANKQSTLLNNVGINYPIADYCSSTGAYFIYISSDMVFGDSPGSQFKEDSIPNASNFYGKCKVAGEGLAQLCAKYAIVRTAMDYDSLQKSEFVALYDSEIMSNSFYNQSLLPIRVAATVMQGKTIQLENDIYCSPTYVKDFCSWISNLIVGQKTGIIHLSGNERVSRFELGKTIEDALGKEGHVISTNSRKDLLRPKDVSLASTDDASIKSSETPLAVALKEVIDSVLLLIPQNGN